LGVVALILVLSVAATLLSPAGDANTDDLDPTNAGPSGARGLARVLSSQGVTVIVARSQSELLEQRVDAATTVAVTNTLHLSGRTAKSVLAHTRSAASLVLLKPDPDVTEGMGLPVTSHLTNLTGARAGCQGAGLGASFRLARAERAYDKTAAGSGARTCFADKANSGGALLTLPGDPGRPRVTLLGDDSLITNGAILEADNAAIALHLLGSSDRLIWYIPSLADIAASDGTSRSIAPVWFRPGLVLVTSAVVFLCLWRGRRLGRLVIEPLPVVVRAVETTESRGRMYRKSRDRTRAMAVLQLATRRRLAAYLGLPASCAVSTVAAAAAAVSGRNYHDVLELLSSPATSDDSSLLERANTLTQLEKEVRRS